MAQRRLKSTRANFADGMKAAKEVKKDLEWTQKRVSLVSQLSMTLVQTIANVIEGLSKQKPKRSIPQRIDQRASGTQPRPTAELSVLCVEFYLFLFFDGG